MARPQNKEELLTLSNTNFNKMLELIDTFDTNEVLEGSFPFEDRDKNIRDILAHLHQWHTMMINWYTVGMSGEKPAMPEVGYTWKTTALLNQKIWEDYQNYSYEDVYKMIHKSFEELQNIINSHTNDELFTKKKYKWTGTTSIGSYLVSSTSSHYDWAIKKLKKYKKMMT